MDALAFSPDGRLLATGSRDRTAKLWDVETETVHATMAHEDWVAHIAFSPDGQLLATSSVDRISKLWDVESGENCWTVTCERFAKSIAFSLDSQYVAMWPQSGTVDIRIVDDGTNAPASIHKEPWISTRRRDPPAQQ